MRILISVTLSILCATAVHAQDDLGPNWKSLFNGKDLTGWQKIGNEKWIVEDGAIYGEGVTQEYGYLATEKPYRDFHMYLRFKCEASGNSGVTSASSTTTPITISPPRASRLRARSERKLFMS